MAERKKVRSALSNDPFLNAGELYRIVRWSKGHPLQSSVGILAAIVVIVGAVVGFSRSGGFAVVFGATLLLAGLVWALFSAAKQDATWERKVGGIVIMLCMVFGGYLIARRNAPHPEPQPGPLPTYPSPSRSQYSLQVFTQRPVSDVGNNDNISTQPQSKSSVEAKLEGSCPKKFRLNERGKLMSPGTWVRASFEAATECRFNALTLVLQQDQDGKYDDWAFEKIQILKGEKVVVSEDGEWAIGDSAHTRRPLEKTIFFYGGSLGRGMQ